MICPNCKSVIDEDSRFCKICGVEFVNEVKQETKVVPVIEKPQVVQTPPVLSPAKNKTNSNKNKMIILISLLVVFVTLTISLFVVLVKNDVFSGRETITDAQGEEIKEGKGTTEMSVLDVDGNQRTIKTDRELLTYDKILAEYTTVMNKLKTDSPAFTFSRYQNLPKEYQNLGAVADFVLPIIERYVTSQTASEDIVYDSGNSQYLPLPESSYGCILTDTTAIKNAYCEVLDDGNYKIVMTLKDEMNPPVLSAGAETSSSITNSVFDTYDALESITAVSELALNKIDFNYTDCTVTLVYNPDNLNVESVNMTMNIDITASIKILGEIKARIVDISDFTEIEY